MRMKLRNLIALMLCMIMLSGCTPQAVPSLPSVTMLPIAAGPEAPLGDAGLQYEAIVPLYLPSQDGQSLLTFYETLLLPRDRHPAESILRALLAHPGNSRVRALGGQVSLSLAGANPVEMSGGVCTVNLSASALMLSKQDLYTVALAITATLCELEDIHHVNMLIAGSPIGMDISNHLPLGTLTPQLGQELPVLWEQMLSRRTPVGERAADTPLTATATLYFPLKDGSGIVAEPRRISFAGQHPQQLVTALLEALSSGADVLSGVADMPNLSALQLFAPEITDLESGGRRVTIHLTTDALNRISAAGCDPACLFAAITTTLTTFVPSLQQVCILTGTNALTSLYSHQLGSMLFAGAVQTRQSFTHALMDTAVVYIPDGNTLTTQTLALPYRSATSPRALLLYMASPTVGALPASLTDADLLGLAIEDGTLLVHFSARYAQAIRESNMNQRLMAYSMVNTLCQTLGVRRVRFYFGGETIDTLDDQLLWSGEFYYHPSLLTQ